MRPFLITEADYRQTAQDAQVKARRARENGDHEWADRLDAWVVEALEQVEILKTEEDSHVRPDAY